MKVYEVGGAVRDALLGKKAKDRDWVVVGSSPEEMISKGFRPIGKDFPVFLHPTSNEEYALARTEKKTGHGYHGFNFYFGKEVTLEEDLSRRDLTINAIAKDEDGNLIDPYGGINDIKKNIFRHVSNAFSEDPLRAIRLARFHTYEHLNKFSIAGETKKLLEIIVESQEIKNLSPDRVWTETERALSSSNPNIYFEVLLKFKLHLPYFEALNVPVCNSSLENEIKWSELQINNKFLLGDRLPVPSSYKNAAYVLEMLLEINNNQNRDYLITALPKINLKRNDELIKKLLVLPQLKNLKDLLLKLLLNTNEKDFSVLSNISKEKISEEKIKLYTQIIDDCL
jgi:tRNA nucleotidyltransferase/poly(A) polymerase